MSASKNREMLIPCATGIILSPALAVWVIYSTIRSGTMPDGMLIGALGVAVLCAAAVTAICRSLCSAVVPAVCIALMTVGGMTGTLLGLSAGGMAVRILTAGAVLVIACCFFDRLLRLMERRWFLVAAAVLSVGLYAATLLMAERTGGAALGIEVFGSTYQVFEAGKLLYIIVTAAVLCINSLRPSSKLLITLGFTLLHCLLLLAQSELGTMLCILAAYFGQLTVWLNEPAAALRAAFWDKWRKFVFVPALLAVIAAAAAILRLYPFIVDKALQRIHGWFNGTYQIRCGMDAMARGGWLGAAEGELVYIPYADSDMVFPSVVQLFGLAAAAAVILLYAALCTSVITASRGTRSTIICSVAVGSAVMITMQGIIAVCASTGLIPMTGITLPFVSNGGMSLAVCAGFAGMMASAVKKPKEGSER